MKHQTFDVLVIGGGHAGCEAAMAASRMGASVCLVTHRFDRIGEMSCNPAIGGLGKGHLVREIDAMDGVMGRVADFAGIQFRLLNRSKGAAVQGPRAQADRDLYRRGMQQEFLKRPEIEIVLAAVSDLVLKGRVVSGVVLQDGAEVLARSVILTAGTFLRGMIHIGLATTPGGRMGDAPANGLGERIESLGLRTGRLKTGTPPRLDGRTIDWSRIEMQPGDTEPELFSFMSGGATQRQIACGITRTNTQTHEIIAENIGKSAVYGGQIGGQGPRYCPSIEDKVVRFAEKDAHQVFLEPEGLNVDVVYPNGISTSLPQDVQEEFVRSITGLEKVDILQPGYAIEYDYVDPRCLDHSLALRDFTGLYLAGQINGTTGYEEAAAQGLIAGINAAAFAQGRAPVVLDRAAAYIGVMVDDLVTRGVTEPYRMFTSRAEYRLLLRADNADRRLTPVAMELGLVSSDRKRTFVDKMGELKNIEAALEGLQVTPTAARAVGIEVNQDGVLRSGLDLLALKDVDFQRLGALFPELAPCDATFAKLVEIDAKYKPYVNRQMQDIARLRQEEARRIPEDIDYSGVSGLSNELAGKLADVRPATLAQAGRIDGMTPAALLLLLSATSGAQRTDRT